MPTRAMLAIERQLSSSVKVGGRPVIGQGVRTRGSGGRGGWWAGVMEEERDESFVADVMGAHLGFSFVRAHLSVPSTGRYTYRQVPNYGFDYITKKFKRNSRY